ncbi:hypothetical protein TSOC_007116 [Tetrabaena socialis]|uniref:Uncharacterized protein n=1 Tax=Tetrabaena socialis TaxID=47790 RepID=A0A2J8A1R1_9CHLO|nr:hypothetical protein TSOC_007116 [Tetrabaena socialis]|eukprot:PNH06453.1 hypothetical protein TSOC_007116 [Tetrabaena socialis]
MVHVHEIIEVLVKTCGADLSFRCVSKAFCAAYDRAARGPVTTMIDPSRVAAPRQLAALQRALINGYRPNALVFNLAPHENREDFVGVVLAEFSLLPLHLRPRYLHISARYLVQRELGIADVFPYIDTLSVDSLRPESPGILRQISDRLVGLSVVQLANLRPACISAFATSTSLRELTIHTAIPSNQFGELRSLVNLRKLTLLEGFSDSVNALTRFTVVPRLTSLTCATLAINLDALPELAGLVDLSVMDISRASSEGTGSGSDPGEVNLPPGIRTMVLGRVPDMPILARMRAPAAMRMRFTPDVDVILYIETRNEEGNLWALPQALRLLQQHAAPLRHFSIAYSNDDDEDEMLPSERIDWHTVAGMGVESLELFYVNLRLQDLSALPKGLKSLRLSEFPHHALVRLVRDELPQLRELHLDLELLLHDGDLADLDRDLGALLVEAGTRASFTLVLHGDVAPELVAGLRFRMEEAGAVCSLRVVE